MREPLLKVIVARPNRPPQPCEGVVAVPFDDLPALRVLGPRLHQRLGGVAELAQLLPRLARVLGLDQLHGDVVHDLAVHGHGDLGKAVGGENGVGALVDDPAFEQPAVEALAGRVDGC